MTKKTADLNTTSSDLEKLQLENQALQDKVVELENNWKRALADYRNLQTRMRDERDDLVKYANHILILKLLFIFDNLELLQQHLDDQGLQMITKAFKEILNEEGLEEITVVEKHFDETVMDAIDTVEGEDGKVMEVIQKGYKLKNKILRPAKVRVGKKGGN